MSTADRARAVARDSYTSEVPEFGYSHQRDAYEKGFIAGAIWQAEQEPPTRDEIAAVLHGDECPEDPEPDETCRCDSGHYYRQADAVLALLEGRKR